MAKLVEIPLNKYTDSQIKRYEELDRRIFKKISETAKEINKKNIIHLSATPLGGGVAELLKSQIPFERTLNLNSYWLVIKAPFKFFVITKKIHNLLQGAGGFLTKEEKNFYLEINNQLAKSLKKFCQRFSSGVIVIHDPQPLPIIQFIPRNFFSILRFHLDLLTPNVLTMEFLKPFIEKYQKIILSSKEYLNSMPWLKKSKLKIIMPAIDPFSEKNRQINIESAKVILQEFGINPSRPIITQVSRFDSWKNPLDVVMAYYLAKNKIPELQLILAGLFLAEDDPEAMAVFKEVKKHARGDPDIHFFTNPQKLKEVGNDTFINALYTASTLTIQNSIREGFGLTITEAMWKEKTVVVRPTSGSKIQIKNNKNGVLAFSTEEIAKVIVRLIKNKRLRERLGRAARQSVKKRFLLPRFVLDNLKVYKFQN